MKPLRLLTIPELEARAVAIEDSLSDMVIFPDMDGQRAHEPAKLLRERAQVLDTINRRLAG
jgi:hypothetical protein